METITLPLSEGVYLRGDFVPGGSRAILFVHGFGSHRGGEKSLALREAAVRHGFTFAAFDFHGHGESSGTLLDLRPSRLLEDLRAIEQFLGAQGVFQIGLVGSSMGGFASSWYAVRHPERIIGCVLLAPGFRFLERRWNALTSDQRETWQRTGKIRFQNPWLDVEVGYGLAEERLLFPPEALYTSWNHPLLIFHGVQDNVVPYTESLELLERATYPGIELRLFKDGDHRLTAYKEVIAESTCRFFLDTLRKHAVG